ncbi:hypothetical protein KVR01_010253 [Diaporthe batatas]|uniref:uncharacterized protein n=1 Tax=Diaporthe batatas TaxID=748121 RepID=UPI001D039E63|nr:uncharacterized protein KVR01_010253 [Diaporthe batatas]KAG8159616.1 hypothetical protein KVR01_010253 [Diaporthe batatas]
MMAEYCTASLELFQKHRNDYIDYMDGHVDEINIAYRLTQDVDCTIKGPPSIPDRFAKWRDELNYHLWNTFKPRESYEKVLPELIKELKEAKLRAANGFQVPKLKPTSKAAHCSKAEIPFDNDNDEIQYHEQLHDLEFNAPYHLQAFSGSNRDLYVSYMKKRQVKKMVKTLKE